MTPSGRGGDLSVPSAASANPQQVGPTPGWAGPLAPPWSVYVGGNQAAIWGMGSGLKRGRRRQAGLLRFLSGRSAS